MADVLSAANDIAQIAGLTIGGAWALHRFVVTRANRTFLEMSVSAVVVGGDADNLLVEVVVRLKNIGASRINARRRDGTALFLFDDTWDQCQHAGTLKVRQVSVDRAPAVFDWYGLRRIEATLTLAATHDGASQIAARPGDLEQINDLADFQDSAGNFRDADFWLEPSESYELTVPMWLPAGYYAFKAFFLGDKQRHGEEAYWSPPDDRLRP